MRRALAVLIFVPVAFAQAPQPVAPIPPSFEQAVRRSTDVQRTFDELRTSIKATDTELTAAIEKVRTARSADVADARADVESKKLKRLREQYEKGALIATKLRDGVTIISFMESLVSVEQSMNAATNIWSNKRLRNNYDRIRDYGAILGAAVGAAAFLTDDEDQRKLLGVTGLGTLSLTRLLGRFLGKEEAARLQAEYEFVQITRAAYDDLLVRKAHVEAFVKANEKFENDVTMFQTKYLGDAATDNAKAERVAELVEYIAQYDVVLRQIPDILQEVTDVKVKYSERLENNPELRKILDTLANQVAQVRERYEKRVRPILDVPAEDRALLRQPYL
jgi:hypothetical protein